MAKAQANVYDELEYGADDAPEFSNFAIDSDVERGPRTRNSSRAAKYPFDLLGVGQSFHVPVSEDMPKPGITLAGAVTNANNKWSHPDPSGATETKTVGVFQTDENGKRVRNADGGFVKIGEEQRTVPVRIAERRFAISTVGAEDKRGPGARVFREL